MKEDLQFAEKLPFPRKYIAIVMLLIAVTILVAIHSNASEENETLKIMDIEGNPVNKIVLNGSEVVLIVENQSNQPLRLVVEWQPKNIKCTYYITNNPVQPKSSTVIKLKSNGYCTVTIRGEPT